jgi:teichuronic acid exporter
MTRSPAKSGFRQAVFRGTVWSGSGIAFRTITQLVVSTILARLLMPEDFGTIAMVTVFISFGQSISDGGFGAALIQKEDLSNDEQTSVFWFNAIISLIYFGIVVAFSPAIANGLGDDDLQSILPILAFAVPIGSLGLVQERMLHRKLNQKIPAILMNVSAVVGGIIGIVAALTGWGAWSLVQMSLTSEVVRVAGLWVFGRWSPKGKFRISCIQELGLFSINVFASRLLMTLFSNLFTMVIGIFYSPAQLGFYSRAQRYQSLPSDSLATAAKNSLYPALSRLQNDNVRFVSALRRSHIMMAFITFPILAMSFSIIDNVVMWVLTEKWRPMVPMFQPLCVMGALHPLYVLNFTALNAKGMSGTTLRLQMIRFALLGIGIACTWNSSVITMVYGQVVCTIVWTLITAAYTHQLVGYRVAEQLRDTLPYAASSILAAMAMIFIQACIEAHYFVEILLAMSVGGAIYGILCHVARSSAINEIKQMVFQYRVQRR